jgi:hypothetical protein
VLPLVSSSAHEASMASRGPLIVLGPDKGKRPNSNPSDDGICPADLLR